MPDLMPMASDLAVSPNVTLMPVVGDPWNGGAFTLDELAAAAARQRVAAPDPRPSLFAGLSPNPPAR